jgi:hypothetical protein
MFGQTFHSINNDLCLYAKEASENANKVQIVTPRTGILLFGAFRCGTSCERYKFNIRFSSPSIALVCVGGVGEGSFQQSCNRQCNSLFA